MRGVQRFSIHRAYGDAGNLPSAHTWCVRCGMVFSHHAFIVAHAPSLPTHPPTYASFNQLDLPAYASQEELRNKLLTAIKEGSEGFGFA